MILNFNDNREKNSGAFANQALFAQFIHIACHTECGTQNVRLGLYIVDILLSQVFSYMC